MPDSFNKFHELLSATGSVNLYQALGESIDYGIWVCDSAGKNIYASESFLKLVGMTQEQCSDFGWGEVLHPEDAEKTMAAWQECVRNEGVWDIEHRFRGVDGQWHPILARGVPVRDVSGRIIFWAGINLDISRMKRAEQAASTNEARLQLALDAAHLATWDWHIPSGVINWNREHFRMLGYEPDSFVPDYQHWADRVHPDDLPATEAKIQTTIAQGTDYQAEFRVVLPDGSVRNLEALGRIERDKNGVATRLYGAMSDITERVSMVDSLRQANENLEQRVAERTAELQQSEHEFRMLAELMPQIVWMTDGAGKNIYFNQRWVHYTGLTLEESYGDGWSTPFHPDDRLRAWNVWQNAVVNLGRYSLECRLRRADGNYQWWLVRGVPILDEHGVVVKWFGTCTDIDEVKKAEEEKRAFAQQLLQIQKLESLGMLAGGIAHDFNNILTAIMGNASLAQMKLAPESPVLFNLQQILQAAERAAELAKQMLAYSGKGMFLIEQLDLNALVTDLVQMLHVSISKKTVLQMNLDPQALAIAADAAQIRQIILNLVINASEAIADNAGVITVSTGSMECDQHYLQDISLDEPVRAGDYVYLEVCDNGCGMDSEIQQKIFDPFFSTKFIGRGLGMAAVQGIVRGHKGAIRICSEPGKGACIKVLLPAFARREKIAGNETVKVDWQGSGTILLVDDEEHIRNIGAEMLQATGFRVLTAQDGQEAVEIFKAEDGISFVILDMTMPQMDGEQCFRELKLINPDVKVIMSSGFSEEDIARRFIGKGLAGFIQKPYSHQLLRDKLQQIIANSVTGSNL